jgi:integrase
MLRLVTSNEMYTLSTLLATYRATLRPHLKWSVAKEKWLEAVMRELGNENLSTLDADRLVRWALASPRSPHSVRCILATLSGVLRAGRELWKTDCHPDAPGEASYRLRMQGRCVTPGERSERVSEDMLAAVITEWRSAIPPRICELLIDTAMRSGEACRTLWQDVNLDRRTVLIRDRKHPTSKTGNHQTIPLLGRSAAVLSEQPRRAERPFPFRQANLSEVFSKASKRAGLPRLHLHDLRHEGISRRFEDNWSIPQVAALSGHRDWKMLKRYTHISPEHLHALEAGK